MLPGTVRRRDELATPRARASSVSIAFGARSRPSRSARAPRHPRGPSADLRRAVRDEFGAAQDRHDEIPVARLDATRPRLSELDRRNLREHVDANRLATELPERTGHEFLGLRREATEPERDERAVQAHPVRPGRLHEDVEVLRVPRRRMHGDRVAPDQQIAHPVLVQRPEHVPPVGVHRRSRRRANDAGAPRPRRASLRSCARGLLRHRLPRPRRRTRTACPSWRWSRREHRPRERSPLPSEAAFGRPTHRSERQLGG